MRDVEIAVARALLILMLAGLAWTGYRLLRRVPSWPLRCVVVILGAFSANLLIVLFAPQATLAAGGPVWLLAVERSPNIIGSALLVAVFDTAASGEQRRSTRLRLNLIVTAASLLALILAASSAPSGYSQTAAGIIYGVENLYCVLARVACIEAALRYRRQAGRRLRHGLAIVIAGFLGDIIASLVYLFVCAYAIATGVVVQQGLGIAIVVITFSVTLDVVGLLTPAALMRLSAAYIWGQHLRDLGKLRPLWTALRRAFPEHELYKRIPDRGGVHLRRHRRLVEIRDGLVRISPHLPPDTPVDDPIAIAQRLPAALQRQEAGESPASQQVLSLLTGSPTLDDEAAALTSLSKAYARVS